jgi:hypothetical protein
VPSAPTGDLDDFDDDEFDDWENSRKLSISRFPALRGLLP